MGSLSGPAPFEDSYTGPAIEDTAAGSTSGDALPNYAASIRADASNSVSHPQPPASPSDLSLEPLVSVNKNKGPRPSATTPTSAPPPLATSLLNTSHINNKEANDDVDSPSAVPRSRAASTGAENTLLASSNHPPILVPPSPPLRVRGGSSSTLDSSALMVGGGVVLPPSSQQEGINVSGSMIRLSAIGNMIDLAGTSSDTNLTYSSSQRMTLAAPPKLMNVINPQSQEEDVMNGLDDSSDEE
eukprot:TRINITY_DN10454_c0_g2_i4.p1 TRINITY_DN10454_c0_g2~~TRINITY_DN10454_c0_g2_i4.p1  ORF type:complete len:243 (-),score=59.50 TRINITY_DN10454_c0_g2_i4:345-1073(-)